MSVDNIKTALLLGGVSPEREVSLESGAGVRAALESLEVELLVVDPAEDSRWLNTLMDNGVERVFNILHGGSGENGDVRGALNCAGIACTGSDVLGSALAMNKHATKKIWRARGIPTADWRYAVGVDAEVDAAAIAADLPPPWFVKPAAGGSSTNATAVLSADDLPAAMANAASEGSGVLVEQLITGAEYTMSVIDDKPLPMIKIVPATPFYDYHAKYVSDETQFFCPCGLDAAEEQRLAAVGMQAFQALYCSGWGRVDFKMADDGEPLFLEVNTVPGMTSHSLVPRAAAQVGLSYREAVERILRSAVPGEGQ